MKDVILNCYFCGRLLRVHSQLYLDYETRWWEGHQIAICEHCNHLIPAETEEDKPKRYRGLQ